MEFWSDGVMAADCLREKLKYKSLQEAAAVSKIVKGAGWVE